MSNLDNVQTHIGTPGVLKHLKAGDTFDVQSGKNAGDNFTVLAADIVHKTHPDVICPDEQSTPFALIITSNYPFDRRGGDTPLRYVIYAQRTS